MIFLQHSLKSRHLTQCCNEINETHFKYSSAGWFRLILVVSQTVVRSRLFLKQIQPIIVQTLAGSVLEQVLVLSTRVNGSQLGQRVVRNTQILQIR